MFIPSVLATDRMGQPPRRLQRKGSMSALPRHTSFRRFAILLMAPLVAPVLVILLSLDAIKPASALTIIDSDTLSFDSGDVGETFDVTYSCAAGAPCGNDTNTSDTDLSGSTSWTIDSLTSTEGVFTVKIANETTDGVLISWSVEIITSSVDAEPFPDNVSIANFDFGGPGGDTDWSATLGTNAAGGFGAVDLCAYAANNCAGGNQKAALIELGMDTVVLTFTGDFSGTTSFDKFPSKFQSVGTSGISLEPGGTVDPPPITEIPEPSTLAIFGFGLVGL